MEVICRLKGCQYTIERETLDGAARSLLAHVRQKHPKEYTSGRASVRIS
ncbi:MAG: hypothetical protein WDA16_09345 [Candidatus Thermoplasmatota archaeon]